jgi:hypothetical protein
VNDKTAILLKTIEWYLNIPMLGISKLTATKALRADIHAALREAGYGRLLEKSPLEKPQE